ncbi:hypothetical protein A2U01_0016160 [Trifolium medium]|uniref:Uncharacterized protein n=1 Tax=Trifolium medium TaxID=97028 RepID=A0A392N7R9_9FABA|nr:hypothetical protein [Trifolium medium]
MRVGLLADPKQLPPKSLSWEWRRVESLPVVARSVFIITNGSYKYFGGRYEHRGLYRHLYALHVDDGFERAGIPSCFRFFLCAFGSLRTPALMTVFDNASSRVDGGLEQEVFPCCLSFRLESGRAINDDLVPLFSPVYNVGGI